MAWERVDLSLAEPDLPVAVGGSVAPHRLLEAYRHGAFPFPCPDGYAAEVNEVLYADHVADGRVALFPGPAPYTLTWWSPPDRPVIPADRVHLSRNLRRDLRNRHRWVTTRDHAFARVVRECRRFRATAWLTDELCAALEALHAAGWAHSVEVWDGEELIGGLFGTGMGRVFGVDSVFSRRPDAGKVAFADLGRRLDGTAGRLIDVQVPSGYTTALGAEPVPRKDYLAALLDIDLPLVPVGGVLGVAALG
ncbi:hypothetical protein AB0M43_08000 [Longispora sp. NPDC051575]|uniref:leucyl/phenylalanyl-tRNA--protein transferase n=1 Tax=Longispora sp. NPDC051575 TaxID=3154943 RepID=UPI0034449590